VRRDRPITVHRAGRRSGETAPRGAVISLHGRDFVMSNDGPPPRTRAALSLPLSSMPFEDRWHRVFVTRISGIVRQTGMSIRFRNNPWPMRAEVQRPPPRPPLAVGESLEALIRIMGSEPADLLHLSVRLYDASMLYLDATWPLPSPSSSRLRHRCRVSSSHDQPCADRARTVSCASSAITRYSCSWPAEITRFAIPSAGDKGRSDPY
jgi:hypothetical protein